MFNNVDATADCSNQLQPQPGKAMTIQQQGADPPPPDQRGGAAAQQSAPPPQQPGNSGVTGGHKLVNHWVQCKTIQTTTSYQKLQWKSSFLISCQKGIFNSLTPNGAHMRCLIYWASLEVYNFSKLCPLKTSHLYAAYCIYELSWGSILGYEILTIN